MGALHRRHGIMLRMVDLSPINRVLDTLGDDFRLFSARRTPPGEGPVAEAERALGVAFDPAYRSFLCAWGSMIVDVKEDVWPRPVEFEVRPLWQMQFGRVVNGVGPGAPPVASTLDWARRMRERTAEPLIPVIHAFGGGAIHCYDGAGRFGIWAHDSGFEPIAIGFVDAVVETITTLREDCERLRTEPIASP
jgi:hypothetical protein